MVGVPVADLHAEMSPPATLGDVRDRTGRTAALRILWVLRRWEFHIEERRPSRLWHIVNRM